MVTNENGTVVSAQTLSGGGALRLISEFLADYRPGPLYHSDPTWGNHPHVFKKAGI
jgi:aspartate/tyrosine/aromatic aminotransferase